MVTLAIDTSSAISVAVMDGDDALASASVYEPRAHAERLAQMVADALAQARVTGADVADVVVGTGPAPFTGLRVGLVTARTMAMAWGVPVRGVCSLDALGAEHGGDVTVVADARRREVYWARYESGVRVDGPHVTVPADVVAPGETIGRGAMLYAEALGVHGEPALLDPDPAWLAREARRRIGAGEDLPVEPLYLRRPDVHGVPGA